MPTAGNYIGVSAQEVKKVAPYCIGSTKLVMKQSEATVFGSDVAETFQDSSNGTMAVVNTLTFNTHGLFFAMLNSIKELDSTVTDLQAQLNAAKGQRNNNSSDSTQGKAPSVHELELANNCTLFQNYPNPFSEGTIIKYFIPDSPLEGGKGDVVSIIFLDEFGNKLKEFNVQEKGMGQLNISATNLASGVYNYSLVVNGRVVATKQMIKSK